MLNDHERDQAIKEGHRNAASDAYFEARRGAHISRRQGFEAGFDRGWDAATALHRVERLFVLAAAPGQQEPPPIDMVLHCPACGKQHVDEAETDDDYREKHLAHGGFDDQWTNPPHRSHLCHGCGHIWRPADVPTNGVAAVKTKGKADSQVAKTSKDEPLTNDQIADMCGDANRGYNIDLDDYTKAVRDTESIHGIGAPAEKGGAE